MDTLTPAQNAVGRSGISGNVRKEKYVRVLENSMTLLKQNIMYNDEFVKKMKEYRVIPDGMVYQLKDVPDRESRNEMFVGFIIKIGAKAFQKLCNLLDITGHKFLSDHLREQEQMDRPDKEKYDDIFTVLPELRIHMNNSQQKIFANFIREKVNEAMVRHAYLRGNNEKERVAEQHEKLLDNDLQRELVLAEKEQQIASIQLLLDEEKSVTKQRLEQVTQLEKSIKSLKDSHQEEMRTLLTHNDANERSQVHATERLAAFDQQIRGMNLSIAQRLGIDVSRAKADPDNIRVSRLESYLERLLQSLDDKEVRMTEIKDIYMSERVDALAAMQIVDKNQDLTVAYTQSVAKLEAKVNGIIKEIDKLCVEMDMGELATSYVPEIEEKHGHKNIIKEENRYEELHKNIATSKDNVKIVGTRIREFNHALQHRDDVIRRLEDEVKLWKLRKAKNPNIPTVNPDWTESRHHHNNAQLPPIVVPVASLADSMSENRSVYNDVVDGESAQLKNVNPHSNNISSHNKPADSHSKPAPVTSKHVTPNSQSMTTHSTKINGAIESGHTHRERSIITKSQHYDTIDGAQISHHVTHRSEQNTTVRGPHGDPLPAIHKRHQSPRSPELTPPSGRKQFHKEMSLEREIFAKKYITADELERNSSNVSTQLNNISESNYHHDEEENMAQYDEPVISVVVKTHRGSVKETSSGDVDIQDVLHNQNQYTGNSFGRDNSFRRPGRTSLGNVNVYNKSKLSGPDPGLSTEGVILQIGGVSSGNNNANVLSNTPRDTKGQYSYKQHERVHRSPRATNTHMNNALHTTPHSYVDTSLGKHYAEENEKSHPVIGDKVPRERKRHRMKRPHAPSKAIREVARRKTDKMIPLLDVTNGIQPVFSIKKSPRVMNNVITPRRGSKTPSGLTEDEKLLFLSQPKFKKNKKGASLYTPSPNMRVVEVNGPNAAVNYPTVCKYV